jgi:hypothetical protein
MASRTYLPTLLAIIKHACKFMARYEDQIKSHLGGGAPLTAFNAVLSACQALVPLLEEIIPPKS